MVAYVVFTREEMRNREEYEQYKELLGPANWGHLLKPLALYGNHEMLEGPAIEGAGILEFPTMEAANTYYRSAAYQEAVKHPASWRRLSRIHRRGNSGLRPSPFRSSAWKSCRRVAAVRYIAKPTFAEALFVSASSLVR
jgi:uncharacterized protein (DUF1330 family)